jgi:hypothetical protein
MESRTAPRGHSQRWRASKRGTCKVRQDRLLGGADALVRGRPPGRPAELRKSLILRPGSGTGASRGPEGAPQGVRPTNECVLSDWEEPVALGGDPAGFCEFLHRMLHPMPTKVGHALACPSAWKQAVDRGRLPTNPILATDGHGSPRMNTNCSYLCSSVFIRG